MLPSMDVVVASSSTETNMSCWDIHTGDELLQYRSCASPPHSLVCVGHSFISSSQLQEKSSSGSLCYWSFHKPQVERKSFLEEQIRPLVTNMDGTYLIGGGVSGHIYVWEVNTGKLLRRWHGHYRCVTCLVLSHDGSLVFSGADDGCVRIWSLFRMFDDQNRDMGEEAYVCGFMDHTLPITDVAVGYGGMRAVVISASEDRTCKVYGLSERKLLRDIAFPCAVHAVVVHPGEGVLYAGCRDGKIYTVALLNGTREKGVMFSDRAGATVTCLALTEDGSSLVSGHGDGTVRLWDLQTRNISHVLKRPSRGPISNIMISSLPRLQECRPLPPPLLQRYIDDEDDGCITVFLPGRGHSDSIPTAAAPPTTTTTGTEDDVADKWSSAFRQLHRFCVEELMGGLPQSDSGS